MALYKTPKAAILGAIYALNGVTLVESEYDYGQPVAVATDPDGTNTTITVTANSELSTFDGDMTVRYIRLPLSELTVLVPSTIQLPTVTSTLEFALAFNKVYGTSFTADDIEDTPVALTDGTGPVTLVAKPLSLGWLGSVTFNVIPGRFPLTGLTTVLPGLNFPDPYENKPFGWAYSYWRDFTLAESLLEPVVVNNPDWVNIRDALIQITGDAWVLNGPTKFSLDGATALYNGPVSGAAHGNDRYDQLLVVQLGAACQNLSGRLFLHYNVPDTDV